MIRRHAARFRLVLMGTEALIAFATFIVLSILRFGDAWQATWRQADIDPFFAASAYAAAWVGLLWSLGLYRLRVRWTARREIEDVLHATVLLGLLAFSVLFVFKLPDVSRLFLLTLFLGQLVVSIVGRSVIRALLGALRDRGYNLRYMLVVGSGPEARRFAARVEGHRELGLRVIGHLTPTGAGAVGPRRSLGDLEDIERVLHDHVVDEVAICLPPEEFHRIEAIAHLCEEVGKIVRIPIVDVPFNLPGGRIEDFDGGKIMSLVYGPDRMAALALKRLVDIVLAALALLVLLPVFAILALLIVRLDGRPILFLQTRVGLHGRPFRLLKLRTMVPEAEARLAELEALNEVKGFAFKVTDDPRLSRTGRVLRRLSLDELPQFWNVLRGEMSLVGPRPPLPREVAQYDLWHRRRLSMKPGITGLWQVAARREDEFDRWVELDLAYIDRWSLWLDLKIMFRTIPAMLQGR